MQIMNYFRISTHLFILQAISDSSDGRNSQPIQVRYTLNILNDMIPLKYIIEKKFDDDFPSHGYMV